MSHQICKIHNEPPLYTEQDVQQNLVFLCRICIQQKLKIKQTDDVAIEDLKQLEVYFDQSIKLLNDFAQVLEQFTQSIYQKLQIFKQQVEQNISHINEKKNYIKNKSKDFTILEINQINKEENLINSLLTEIKFQLNNQIKEIEKITKLDQLYSQINNLSIKKKCKHQQQDDIKKCKFIDKKIDYQLIQQSSYKQNEQCHAIAFNKDNSIMIASCAQIIKVFEFQNDKLRQVQDLNGHQDYVLCLKFMKKSNQFVSGSEDNTIVIWGLSQNNIWHQNQILKNHKSSIYCITMNQNEDLLISGTYDFSIIFWKKQDNTWSCNKSIDCQNTIFSISLNDQEDKLIASLYSNQILVISLEGKEWMIKQKISVKQYGYRLCFINQYQFVFQSFCGQYLQIFEHDSRFQTFKKGQELQYQDQESVDIFSFPIQYLPQIGLTIVKNGHNVHLIKRNQNGQFKVEQSINFDSHKIYGCTSDDGRYIVSWSYQSKEIQIRKFEF